MELKCKKCGNIFELDTDNCECESIEQDGCHTRFDCNHADKCPSCSNTFDITYEYWSDNNSGELLNGYEIFFSDEVELVTE
jgi:uncharacterized C2H2 Zn-finger protein